jgi:hypothetical protein
MFLKKNYYIWIPIIVLIVVIVFILVFSYSQSLLHSQNELASVNGTPVTKNELINYTCSNGINNCKNNYISQLQNFINYELEYQYLKNNNKLPSKYSIYNYYKNNIPQSTYLLSLNPSKTSLYLSENNFFSNQSLYYKYYQLDIQNIVGNMLLKNYTVYIFIYSGNSAAGINLIKSEQKELSSNPANRLSLLKNLNGENMVSELIYNINSLNYKNTNIYSFFNLNSNMKRIIFSTETNSVSPIEYSGNMYYFVYNKYISNGFSNINEAIKYLRSNATVYVY